MVSSGIGSPVLLYGTWFSAQNLSRVKRASGSYRFDANPADFRSIPAGISARQLYIGDPKILNAMPRARR